jgi:two-component system response regulator NreC
MTTIILADDHQVVRQGVRALLENQPDIRVIAEAGDGLEAVRLVEELKPNVLILDLMMPGISGMEVTRNVRKASPNTRIIIFTMYSDLAYVAESLKYGANAYILKGSPGNDLLQAVKEVVAGRRYLSGQLTEYDLDAYFRMTEKTRFDAYDTLTMREREVLKMAAEGLGSHEIAERLSISPRTVEVHRANMMRKLSLSNQTELVRYALQRGITSLEA